MAEKSNRARQSFAFVILGGALGVALLVFGGIFSGDGKKSEADIAQSVTVYDDADAYAAMLEQRVSEICSGVYGAGEARVFVSLKGGYRTVYAVDAQSSGTGYRSEIVMSGSGSDKKAVVSAYENPEIAGVGIVCDGGGKAEVREEIISLVSAALNISTNKIFVAQAS